MTRLSGLIRLSELREEHARALAAGEPSRVEYSIAAALHDLSPAELAIEHADAMMELGLLNQARVVGVPLALAKDRLRMARWLLNGARGFPSKTDIGLSAPAASPTPPPTPFPSGAALLREMEEA